MVKTLLYFFSQRTFLRSLVVVTLLGFVGIVLAESGIREDADSLDTVLKKSTPQILSQVGPRLIVDRGGDPFKKNNSIDIQKLKRSQFLSVQQLLKGNIDGVYVQENNGEPGSIQSMLIRGLSSPVFSNKDLSGVQPTVYVNGIPITQDHPYVYDFKQYDINPIGTATNLLAGLDIGAIESLEVIKDPLELAKLGPLAANGAIWIITKDGFYGGKNVSINASAGVSFAPSSVKMTNGGNERAFRQGLYDAHNTPVDQQYFPNYLSDNRNPNYFGNPDWADSYYRSAPMYNVNASIGSGNSLANYVFTLGLSNEDAIVKDVGMTKYNIGFALNLIPMKGLSVSTYINANRLDRKRNNNFRDRLAEVEYVPDLSMPFAPSNGAYGRFRTLNDLTKDENINNTVNGYLALRYIKDRFHASVGLQLDYSTNVRHVFWPSTLMETVSFVSDFSGYNRRLIGNTTAGYAFNFGADHALDVRWDGSIQSDYFHYNYSKGYDGDDDTKTTTKSGGFSKIYGLADRLENRLVSTSVAFDYNYRKIFYAGVLLRYDGTSNIQLDDRWLFTPSFSLGWDLKKHLFDTSSILSKLSLKTSWARIGRVVQSDRFALGPNYVSSEMPWIGQPMISSANGFATITRPYSIGWVGYDMGWPYSDKLSVDLNASFLKNRINVGLSFYENRDKDLIAQLPVVQEYGYRYEFANGMEISNRGVDINIAASIFNYNTPDRLDWDIALNMNFNKNELKKLPRGLDEIVINDRKLQVGKSVDAFWLYRNNGIYTDNNQVPVQNGNLLSTNGVAFQKGDPIWADSNGDNVIDDNDRVLKGNALPKVMGGLTNQLRYKQFDLGFHFLFALGHSALNIRDHDRYDFMTNDRMNNVQTVREIFFWQEGHNQKNDYTLYNPLSKVNPYRAEQDMFLEKLSYLKLRSVTLGYTLELKKSNKPLIESLYFYLTANNLFTVTSFSGEDPELVNFNGYYDGYMMPLPRSLSAGLRFKF